MKSNTMKSNTNDTTPPPTRRWRSPKGTAFPAFMADGSTRREPGKLMPGSGELRLGYYVKDLDKVIYGWRAPNGRALPGWMEDSTGDIYPGHMKCDGISLHLEKGFYHQASDQIRKYRSTVVVPIFRDQRGAVIGVKGRTVKGIEKDTGCSVQVHRQTKGSSKQRNRNNRLERCVISGTDEAAVQRAAGRIEGIKYAVKYMRQSMRQSNQQKKGYKQNNEKKTPPNKSKNKSSNKHHKTTSNEKKHHRQMPTKPIQQRRRRPTQTTTTTTPSATSVPKKTTPAVKAPKPSLVAKERIRSEIEAKVRQDIEKRRAQIEASVRADMEAKLKQKEVEVQRAAQKLKEMKKSVQEAEARLTTHASMSAKGSGLESKGSA